MFHPIKGFVLTAVFTSLCCANALAQGPLQLLDVDVHVKEGQAATENEQKEPATPANPVARPCPCGIEKQTQKYERRYVEIPKPAETQDIETSLRLIPVKLIEQPHDELRRIRMLSVNYPRHVVSNAIEDDGEDDPAPAAMPQKFHWKPAIYQSLIAQGFQHGYALVAQEKTRRALKGPFFSEYWDSIKGINKWDDGNKFFTNYIAHPMQGSMTGFIYLQNHDRLKRQMFNESKQYWKDRAMALLWSAAWSTNWEIGPISQASIGNVGYYGHGGYVDLVITPTVGTAWMVTEEALDRYIIRHAEKNLAARIVLRTTLNPTRSVTNLLRFKKPWYRDRAN